MIRYYLCVSALGVLLQSLTSASAEAPVLVPRIGETVQEFEARKRGVAVPKPAQDVVVVADQRGHFYLDPELNGRPIRMVVDTGASVVALTYEDAERVGARVSTLDFTLPMSTANGPVAAAPFRIREMRVGDLSLPDVEAVILPQGKLAISLLGMSFLRRLQGFHISRGRLSLRR